MTRFHIRFRQKQSVALSLCLVLVVTALFVRRDIPRKITNFEAEENQIDNDISALRNADPLDGEKTTRLVYRLYHKASLTAKTGDFQTAESAIKRAIERIGSSPDLCLLKANFDFRFHRLVETKTDLGMVAELENQPAGETMQADLDLQEGRYEAARKGYETVIQNGPTWDVLARLAYLESKIGDTTRADQLYAQAEDEITAKEMRAYAWVELQRGLLDLSHGHFEEALDHYKQADNAYSGYWLVDEYRAELLGARGEFDKAVALYKKVIARSPRPEAEQALGDLYLFFGKLEMAKQWHQKALAGYLESVQRGEVQYFHHLTGFYADSQEDGPEALKWAYRDLAIRKNFASYEAVAWALYRSGSFDQALEAMETALSCGVKDAHIFFHAAMICTSAGQTTQGQEFLAKAAQTNLHYNTFHVHR